MDDHCATSHLHANDVFAVRCAGWWHGTQASALSPVEQMGLAPRKKHGPSERQGQTGVAEATVVAVVDPSELNQDVVRYSIVRCCMCESHGSVCVLLP